MLSLVEQYLNDFSVSRTLNALAEQAFVIFCDKCTFTLKRVDEFDPGTVPRLRILGGMVPRWEDLRVAQCLTRFLKWPAPQPCHVCAKIHGTRKSPVIVHV